ncbi:hypothetical protein GUJ93_ZPchr0069g33259 [Zizania palustris]|uniref:Uncharacterized protein n=1 Tax=Zizania palustris TaxID=103762 RepID=A0A8J5R304_ZIZPA|nr:hypothetical protein GUJ93_ZPchr0069g33259 [Zizania palustris]
MVMRSCSVRKLLRLSARLASRVSRSARLNLLSIGMQTNSSLASFSDSFHRSALHRLFLSLIQKTRCWAPDLPTPLLLGLTILFRLLSLKKQILES